jgi:hypothetical protein
LLSGAAYNLADARIGHGMLHWKAHGGYGTIRCEVCNEQWDVVEIAATGMCLRSVVTTLDLCAAVLFRRGHSISVGRPEFPSGALNRRSLILHTSHSMAMV